MRGARRPSPGDRRADRAVVPMPVRRRPRRSSRPRPARRPRLPQRALARGLEDWEPGGPRETSRARPSTAPRVTGTARSCCSTRGRTATAEALPGDRRRARERAAPTSSARRAPRTRSREAPGPPRGRRRRLEGRRRAAPAGRRTSSAPPAGRTRARRHRDRELTSTDRRRGGRGVPGCGVEPDDQPVAELGMYCVAGADLPADDRRIARVVRAARPHQRDVVRNDTFAVLRAGTERRGASPSCAATARTARASRRTAGRSGSRRSGTSPGTGEAGTTSGSAALWYARPSRGRAWRADRPANARARALRAPPRRASSPRRCTSSGSPSERVVELAPIVFRAAATATRSRATIVDRQADEIVAMAGVGVRRLHMTKLDVEVVLGGGVFSSATRTSSSGSASGLVEVAAGRGSACSTTAGRRRGAVGARRGRGATGVVAATRARHSRTTRLGARRARETAERKKG